MPIYGTGSQLQNHLSNSGFDVWTRGTLENVGSELFGTWTNNGSFPYETYTTSGDNITSAINTTGYGASYQIWTPTVGKLYRFSYNLTLNSGTAPTAYYDSSSSTGFVDTQHQLVAGANSFVFEAGLAGSQYFNLSVNTGVATNFSLASCTLYEVTPACLGGSNYDCCDGWSTYDHDKIDVYRQHSDGSTEAVSKLGSFYSMKIVTTAGTSMKYPGITERTKERWWGKFKGQTVAFGMWTKSSAASQARVLIWYEGGSGGGTYTNSSWNSGTGWEWLEVSTTIANDIGDSSTAGLQVGVEYSTNNGTQYVSQPMFVIGSSIGAGNYSRPVGEIIWFEKMVQLTDYAGSTAVSSNTGALDIEAQSNGKIPKGAKAINVSLVGYADGDSESLYTYDGSDTDLRGTWGLTQSPNGYISSTGFQQCDSNGDFGIGIDATYAGVRLRCTGVELR